MTACRHAVADEDRCTARQRPLEVRIQTGGVEALGSSEGTSIPWHALCCTASASLGWRSSDDARMYRLMIVTTFFETKMGFVEEQASMTQSIVDSPSQSRLAELGREGRRDQEQNDRPLQEIIARRVSRRARRRLFVAMLPLLLVSAALAYVLASYGV